MFLSPKRSCLGLLLARQFLTGQWGLRGRAPAHLIGDANESNKIQVSASGAALRQHRHEPSGHWLRTARLVVCGLSPTYGRTLRGLLLEWRSRSTDRWEHRTSVNLPRSTVEKNGRAATRCPCPRATGGTISTQRLRSLLASTCIN